MKKKVVAAFILAAFLLVIFAGCSGAPTVSSSFREVNTIDGVWIEADPETITPTSMEIVFQNRTERSDLTYAAWYWIERRDDENWHEVSTLPDATVGGPLIDLHIPSQLEIERIESGVSEYSVDPDGELPWFRYPPNRMGYNWENVYGVLPSGEYRIVLEVGDGVSDYYLTANFTIPEGV